MEIKRAQIMSKNIIERGQIIQDEHSKRYLVLRVNRDKNSVTCLDDKFNSVGIGLDFLKNYTYIETIDMEFFINLINEE